MQQHPSVNIIIELSDDGIAWGGDAGTRLFTTHACRPTNTYIIRVYRVYKTD